MAKSAGLGARKSAQMGATWIKIVASTMTLSTSSSCPTLKGIGVKLRNVDLAKRWVVIFIFFVYYADSIIDAIGYKGRQL
jgi:hypothetical protein